LNATGVQHPASFGKSGQVRLWPDLTGFGDLSITVYSI